jgi:hypothetical protein
MLKRLFTALVSRALVLLIAPIFLKNVEYTPAISGEARASAHAPPRVYLPPLHSTVILHGVEEDFWVIWVLVLSPWLGWWLPACLRIPAD